MIVWHDHTVNCLHVIWNQSWQWQILAFWSWPAWFCAFRDFVSFLFALAVAVQRTSIPTCWLWVYTVCILLHFEPYLPAFAPWNGSKPWRSRLRALLPLCVCAAENSTVPCFTSIIFISFVCQWDNYICILKMWHFKKLSSFDCFLRIFVPYLFWSHFFDNYLPQWLTSKKETDLCSGLQTKNIFFKNPKEEEEKGRLLFSLCSFCLNGGSFL